METYLNEQDSRRRKEKLIDKLRERADRLCEKADQIRRVYSNIEYVKMQSDEDRRKCLNNEYFNEKHSRVTSSLQSYWYLTSHPLEREYLFGDKVPATDLPFDQTSIRDGIYNRTMTKELFEKCLRNAISVLENIKPQHRFFVNREWDLKIEELKEILAKHCLTPYASDSRNKS